MAENLLCWWAKSEQSSWRYFAAGLMEGGSCDAA